MNFAGKKGGQVVKSPLNHSYPNFSLSLPLACRLSGEQGMREMPTQTLSHHTSQPSLVLPHRVTNLLLTLKHTQNHQRHGQEK